MLSGFVGDSDHISLFRHFWQNLSSTLEFVKVKCEHLYEIRFRDGFSKNVKSKKRGSLSDNKMLSLQPKRSFSTTRSKKLYDNCYLQAPDGELLCTIDRKKAEWWVHLIFKYLKFLMLCLSLGMFIKV